MGKLLKSCCIGALVLAGHAAYSEPKIVVERLAQLTGPNAINCSPSEFEKSLTRAFSCAEAAIAASKAFFVVIHFSGCTDCSYWNGAAGSAEGALWEVIYDTNPRGLQNDTPVLATNPCSKLRFNPKDYPYIMCLEAHRR